MNQKQVFSLIASLSGQANVLTIPRIFIDLTGSVTSGLFLSQCIYWSDKTTHPGGWFYKSKTDWKDELGMTRRQIDNALQDTAGIVEVKQAMAEGAFTFWYRINFEALVQGLENLADRRVISDSTSSHNQQIVEPEMTRLLTETTPEITTKTEGGDGKEEKSRRPLMTWDLLEVKPGKEKTAALMVFETTQSLYSAWAPPAVVDLGVAFTEAAKIDPPLDKSGRSRWRKCLLDLLQNQISPESIRKTVEYMTGKGLTITGPWSVADLAQAGVADKEAPKGFTRFVPGQTQL